MKLIEAMSQYKLNEKRINAKCRFIAENSSTPSFRRGDAAQMREKIANAKREALALIHEQEVLKRKIDFTNIMAKTKVKVKDIEKEYSLHTLILHKRTPKFGDVQGRHNLCDLKRQILEAHSDQAAKEEIDRLRSSQKEGIELTAQVVLHFDPELRDRELGELEEFEAAVDAALQIANSQIDLMDPDTYVPAPPPALSVTTTQAPDALPAQP